MTNISIDFDGVLVKTMDSYVKRYNELYGKNKTVNDIIHWDMYADFGITREQSFDILKYIWTDWITLQAQEPVLHAKVGQLRVFGNVDVVTAVLPEYVQFAQKWLLRNNIPCKVIRYHDKEKLDYTYYVDDSPKLAQRILGYSNKTLFLYDQPWNRGVPKAQNVIRIYNMSQAYTNIFNMEKGKESFN